MYCKNCGKEIPDESNFCLYCGAPLKKQEEKKGGKSIQNDLPENIKIFLNLLEKKISLMPKKMTSRDWRNRIQGDSICLGQDITLSPEEITIAFKEKFANKCQKLEKTHLHSSWITGIESTLKDFINVTRGDFYYVEITDAKLRQGICCIVKITGLLKKPDYIVGVILDL